MKNGKRSNTSRPSFFILHSPFLILRVLVPLWPEIRVSDWLLAALVAAEGRARVSAV